MQNSNGHIIHNFDELATDDNRRDAMLIAEAGIAGINTNNVIHDSIILGGDILKVQGQEFDLTKYKSIKVVGLGKAAPEAAEAIESILAGRIDGGVVLGINEAKCKNIETFAGTHPRPSDVNEIGSEKIYQLAKNADKDDLIIAIISGGGSALICYPESECVQGKKLYDNFLHSGKTIIEINTIRKHLSLIKGGGLAKIAYPATVVGLIFSDVPGNNFEMVASGPTYKDHTTVEDARKIINEYDLGEFDLIETPKEDFYFEKVHNFVLVSNQTAVDKMKQKAEELGYAVDIAGTEIYDTVPTALLKIFGKHKSGTVVLAAGEPKLEVTGSGGSGGRNLYMSLYAAEKNHIDDDTVFVPLASDGRDNSDVAGAIVDKQTINELKEKNVDMKKHLEHFDAYNAFVGTNSMIVAGPTGANVSDLMILLNAK